MEQVGNIIQRKKIEPTDAPKAQTAIRNIATALLEFHKTNPSAFEDKRNPHFKNQYASLESVINTVRTASQFGLTFTQEMDFEGDITFVRTVMMHSSGDTRVSRTKIVSKDPNDPQKQGSAISYAKRYDCKVYLNCHLTMMMVRLLIKQQQQNQKINLMVNQI